MLRYPIALAAYAVTAALLPGLVHAAPGAVDSGNTTWLLVSSALVMLMTPGLAFFYAGMVSRKNVVSTLLQNYVALAIVGLLWITVGYSMAFSDGNAFLGGLDNVFFKGLETAVDDDGVPALAFAVFQMMFAIIAPALITGSFAERVRFKSWMLLMALWSLCVYVPVAHWVWGPGGWIEEMGAIDFAGGLVVHITSGFSALVAAFLYGKRTDKIHSIPNDIPMMMLGTALLFFGWFGFNAGSALTAGVLASHAFVTTFAGASAAFVAWMVTDWVRTGRPSAVGGMIGIVVGLVAITPAAGFVSIPHAILLSALTAVICNVSARALKKVSHMDDALEVFACHGLGGFLGAVFTGLFASRAVNPDLAVEGLLISGEGSLFFANATSSILVVAYSMGVTFVLIKLVALLTPLRVSADEEDKGLDASIHGEMAKYHRRRHSDQPA